MATFLFVPGAWHRGWAFDPVRAGLEALGHAVVTPDLPLEAGEATLERWVAFIGDLAGRQGEPVVLAGHSRGGIVISQVAETAPRTVRALVYISAFLVPGGSSINDLVGSTPRNEDFAAGLSPTPDGLCLALTPEAAMATFYNRCPAGLAGVFARRLVPEPMQPMGATLALSDDHFGRVPRHYIECTDDLAIPLAQQRAMQAALPCATVATLDSDHTPMLCCPDALVDALHAIAGI